MTRLKWLWWKFWAWATKPWQPKDVLGNPRGKKVRYSRAYWEWVDFMRNLNLVTMLVILYAIYVVLYG